MSFSDLLAQGLDLMPINHFCVTVNVSELQARNTSERCWSQVTLYHLEKIILILVSQVDLELNN